jgi:hypothetical protein
VLAAQAGDPMGLVLRQHHDVIVAESPFNVFAVHLMLFQ